MKAKSLAVILILSGLFVNANRGYACPPPEQYPVARLTADPQHVVVGNSVTLDGSNSSPPASGGSIVKYEWDFNYNGSTFRPDEEQDCSLFCDGIAIHTYNAAGTYEVMLRVTADNGWTDTDTDTVYVYANSNITWCVDENATGSGNGRSWGNAFNRLQDALAVAVFSDEIWVAEGTYYPDQGSGETLGDRSATFQLKRGVDIYGGFPSGGGDWASHDPVAHQTILSGDIDEDGVLDGQNSYHVVTGTDGGMLDGFTITGGYADAPVYCGGGIYSSGGPMTITISNCVIIDNEAEWEGGGMYNYRCSAIVTNCFFIGNKADGGGMYNCGSSQTLTNCVFSGNSANRGGGIRNAGGASPTLINCTFSNNSADTSGGGIFAGQNSTVTNCIFWENCDGPSCENYDESAQIYGSAVVNYSCIQDEVPGDSDIPFGGADNHNIDDDPDFVDAGTPAGADGDFGTWDDGLQLSKGSPCTDAGDNKVVFPGLTGWWTLDDENAANTTVVDSSGNDNDGMAQRNTSALHTDSGNPPYLNGAFTFNGSSDYVDIPDSPSLDLSSEASVSAWVYIIGDGIGNGVIAIKQEPTGTPGASYALTYLVASDKITFSIETVNNAWADYPSNTVLSTNTWYHVAGTYRSGELKIYINGDLDKTYTMPTGDIDPTNGPLHIGQEDAWQQELFYGRIDDVRIYDTALSEDEIKDLYECLFTDIIGTDRVLDGDGIPGAFVDMGAYESPFVDLTVSAVRLYPSDQYTYNSGDGLNDCQVHFGSKEGTGIYAYPDLYIEIDATGGRSGIRDLCYLNVTSESDSITGIKVLFRETGINTNKYRVYLPIHLAAASNQNTLELKVLDEEMLYVGGVAGKKVDRGEVATITADVGDLQDYANAGADSFGYFFDKDKGPDPDPYFWWDNSGEPEPRKQCGTAFSNFIKNVGESSTPLPADFLFECAHGGGDKIGTDGAFGCKYDPDSIIYPPGATGQPTPTVTQQDWDEDVEWAVFYSCKILVGDGTYEEWDDALIRELLGKNNCHGILSSCWDLTAPTTQSHMEKFCEYMKGDNDRVIDAYMDSGVEFDQYVAALFHNANVEDHLNDVTPDTADTLMYYTWYNKPMPPDFLIYPATTLGYQADEQAKVVCDVPTWRPRLTNALVRREALIQKALDDSSFDKAEFDDTGCVRFRKHRHELGPLRLFEAEARAKAANFIAQKGGGMPGDAELTAERQQKVAIFDALDPENTRNEFVRKAFFEYTHSIDGIEIVGGHRGDSILVTVAGNQVVGLRRHWRNIVGLTGSLQQVISASDALIVAVENIPKVLRVTGYSITEIKLFYYGLPSQDEYQYLSPAWGFQVDGHLWVYVNAFTGEFLD